MLMDHGVLNGVAKDLRSGLVDHLEGKTLGERLGSRREPYAYSDFPPANHFFSPVRVVAPHGRLAYRNSWTGCLLTLV